MVEALDSAYLIVNLLKEVMDETESREIKVYTDNKSLYDALHTTNLVNDKRLRVDIAALREMREKENVKFSWVNAGHQLADVLTKRGASKKEIMDVLTNARLEV